MHSPHRAAVHLIAVALLGAVLGACGGGGTATPGASQRPSAGATIPLGTARATGGTATVAPGIGFHAAPDLEGTLPTRAGGRSLTVESVAGTGFSDFRRHNAGLRCRWYEDRGLRCRDQAQLDLVLDRLGRTRGDVTIAVSYDATRGGIEIQSLRIAGASGKAVLDAVLSVMQDRATTRGRPLDLSTTTIAGRQVSVITYRNAYPLGKQRYFHASASTLFEVRKAGEAVAAEVIGGLE